MTYTPRHGQKVIDGEPLPSSLEHPPPPPPPSPVGDLELVNRRLEWFHAYFATMTAKPSGCPPWPEREDAR